MKVNVTTLQGKKVKTIEYQETREENGQTLQHEIMSVFSYKVSQEKMEYLYIIQHGEYNESGSWLGMYMNYTSHKTETYIFSIA